MKNLILAFLLVSVSARAQTVTFKPLNLLGAVLLTNLNKMNWTEPKPPTEGISCYDHTICETPFGKLKIEWKSWKENDSYDIMLNDSDWIGAEYDLESAKELARNYLVKKHKELSELLGL